MSTIGQILTAARDRAGYTIAELSSRTCIRESVLSGMERDDFAPCGADFYARGHIKAVCRELAVDPAELLHRYEEEHARVPQQASASDDAEQTVAAARAGLDGRAEEQRRGLFAPLRDAVADALHPHGDRSRTDGPPAGEQGEEAGAAQPADGGASPTASAGSCAAVAADSPAEGGTPAVPAQSAPDGGRGAPQDSDPGSAGGSSPRGPSAGAAGGALPGGPLGGYGSGASPVSFGATGATGTVGAAGAPGGSHPLGAEPGPRADGRAPDDWRDAARGPEARPSGAVQGEHALRDLFAGAGWAADPAGGTGAANAGSVGGTGAADAADSDTVDLTGRADTLDLSDALDPAAAEDPGGATAAAGTGRTRPSGGREARAGRRPADR
ncbi:helix-turn-helix domain-containing protein, partial [Nocardiopsis coralliicola]